MKKDQVSSESAPDFIYPPLRNPYYIVAPRYLRTSAGVKALHLLCHSLNRVGQTAYIFPFPYAPGERAVCPDFLTPIVTPHVIRYHYENGCCPIVVYAETVAGNPLKAPVVARYVLNFPGLLGGDKDYPASEICFGYSQKLAEIAHHPDQVLFIPTTNVAIFNRGTIDVPRKGTCYFADKYKNHHNGKLFDITKDSIEITRNRPDSQTPQQIAEIFRRSELFYCYENSALALEAILCGCPAVFLPNEHLTESIAVKELGWDGLAWGADPDSIARAKTTVHKAAENYLKHYDLFWQQLDHFVDVTQKRAATTVYVTPIQSGVMGLGNTFLVLLGFVATAWHVLKFEGPQALSEKIKRKLAITARNGWLRARAKYLNIKAR